MGSQSTVFLFVQGFWDVNSPPVVHEQELNATRKDRGWKQRPFVRAADFDRTPMHKAKLRKLDEIVLDHTVVDIIHAMYGNVSQTWAKDYPEDASYFFSDPYPQIAVNALGYGVSTSYHNMGPPAPVSPSTKANNNRSVSWDYDPSADSSDDGKSPPLTQSYDDCADDASVALTQV